MSTVLTIEKIDAGLDAVYRARAQVLAEPATAARCLRLAELADREASWWEALSEHSRLRVHWRAALTARQHALAAARHWRIRAQHLQHTTPPDAPATAAAKSEAA